MPRGPLAGDGNRLRPIRAGSGIAGRSGDRSGPRRTTQWIALDFAADQTMTNEEQIAMPAELEMKSGADQSSAIAADISDQSKTPKIPEELAILPVRGFVVFPGTIVPLNV